MERPTPAVGITSDSPPNSHHILLYYNSAKLSEAANAFAVLSVKIRSGSSGFSERREKLSLSAPQVYQDLPGAVQVSYLSVVLIDGQHHM